MGIFFLRNAPSRSKTLAVQQLGHRVGCISVLGCISLRRTCKEAKQRANEYDALTGDLPPITTTE